MIGELDSLLMPKQEPDQDISFRIPTDSNVFVPVRCDNMISIVGDKMSRIRRDVTYDRRIIRYPGIDISLDHNKMS